MIFVRPIVLAGIGLAAATPWILHGHASPDCNPTKELCAVSDALYLPEDPAPEHAPPMIFAPPVAGYTATATGTALLRSFDSPSPRRWRSLTALEGDEQA
jgi:hypothetical protein